jgi:hypothetical protein
MNATQIIKAAIAVVAIVALVVSGKGARRPETTTRNETPAIAVVL